MRFLHRGKEAQFAELGFTLLNAGGLECIDEREQLPLPAYELGAGLATATE